MSIVSGAARAFGAALALTSDITIATPAASFGLPEMSRGVVPSFAIALLRTRHTSGLVRQLALTTHPIGAEDAVQHGLANVLVPDTEQAERHAHGLLSLWSQVGAAAVRSTTQTLADVDAAPDHDALRQIAVDGVEEQLRRFGEGQTDQNYLNVDGTADLPDM